MRGASAPSTLSLRVVESGAADGDIRGMAGRAVPAACCRATSSGVAWRFGRPRRRPARRSVFGVLSGASRVDERGCGGRQVCCAARPTSSTFRRVATSVGAADRASPTFPALRRIGSNGRVRLAAGGDIGGLRSPRRAQWGASDRTNRKTVALQATVEAPWRVRTNRRVDRLVATPVGPPSEPHPAGAWPYVTGSICDGPIVSREPFGRAPSGCPTTCVICARRRSGFVPSVAGLSSPSLATACPASGPLPEHRCVAPMATSAASLTEHRCVSAVAPNVSLRTSFHGVVTVLCHRIRPSVRERPAWATR